MHSNDWDGSYIQTTRIAAKRAYEEAGVSNPREEIGMLEVHDCFSITELVTTEDLFISPEGGAIRDILDGFYDADVQLPCQIDGGLKCRSEERRVGKECVSKFRSRWWREHKTKK